MTTSRKHTSAIGEPAGSRGDVTDAPDQSAVGWRGRVSGDSEELYGLVTETADDLIYVTDIEGRVLYSTPSVTRLLGRDPARIIGASLFDNTHQEDIEAARQVWSRVLAGEKALTALRVRHEDGSWRWLEACEQLVSYRGRPHVIIACRDITDRKKEEAFRDGQTQVLELIATNTALPETLSRLARLVESRFDGMLCSILLLDDDGVHVRHGAAPSLPDAYVKAVDGAAIGPRAGSCGTAMYWGRPVFVVDILVDPLWDDCRALAAPHGLRACWSTPIMSHQGTVLGTFAMYYQQPRGPTPAELRVMDAATHMAGIAVERTRTEQTLSQREAQYRRLIDHIPEVVWTADEHGNAVFLSNRVTTVFGYKPEENYREGGSLWFGRMHPEDRERVREEFARLFAENRPFAVEYRIRHRDGHWMWWHDRAVAIYEQNGKRYADGLLSDITERKDAEEALRQSHALLQGIIEGTTDSVFVKDREGRYVTINSSGARRAGKSIAEIIGQDDIALFGPDVGASIMEIDREIMASGAPRTYEQTLPFPSQRRTLFMTKGPHRDSQGRVVGVIGIARDMTDFKRLEEQLRHSQKMEAIGLLAGGVAHDFNNLLTVINGYAELLLNPATPADRVHDLVLEIARAGQRAASLTSQLLAFGRRQMLRPETLNLNQVVASSESLLSRLIGEHIELLTVLDPELWPVNADRGQLAQVIMNLAVNARDAMPRGGKLIISTANEIIDSGATPGAIAPGRYVRLQVVDTGCGMSAEILARVFEPFFTTKEVGKGTGLGLAMVYGIITQSGGDISVASQVGEGTTLTIRLPAIEQPSTPAAPRTPPREVPVAAATVLVVEDEESVRKLVSRILKQDGHRVLEAGDGREALAVSDRHEGHIDLLLTDLVMPNMSGPEVARRLVQQRPAMRVLYMSGYSDDSVVVREVAERRMPLLLKPFTRAALGEMVRKVLLPRATAS